MNNFPKTSEEFVSWAAPKILEIHQGLYGVPNSPDDGLVGIVRENGHELFRLKRTVWTLIGVLIGSGILGGSLYTFLK